MLALGKLVKETEAQIQKSIIDYIKIQYKNAIIFHIPNSGKRSFATARFFKDQGLMVGCPDLAICWSPGRFGMLEVKSPTGRLSSHQRAAIERLRAIKIPVEIVHSLDDAIQYLKLWGVK